MGKDERRHRETRKQFIDRVQPKVAAGETIHDLWTVYYEEKFSRASPELLPDHVELLKEVFYAGIASMFQLTLKLSGPEEEDDEIGAERLTRLHEELDTYTRQRR